MRLQPMPRSSLSFRKISMVLWTIIGSATLGSGQFPAAVHAGSNDPAPTRCGCTCGDECGSSCCCASKAATTPGSPQLPELISRASGIASPRSGPTSGPMTPIVHSCPLSCADRPGEGVIVSLQTAAILQCSAVGTAIVIDWSVPAEVILIDDPHLPSLLRPPRS